MKKIKEVLKSIGIVFFAIFLPWVIFCIRLKPETQERIRTVTKVVIPIMCVVMMFATPIVINRIKNAEQIETLKGEMTIEFIPKYGEKLTVKLSEITEENNHFVIYIDKTKNSVSFRVTVKEENKVIVREKLPGQLYQKGYVRISKYAVASINGKREQICETYIYRNKNFDSLKYSKKLVLIMKKKDS